MSVMQLHSGHITACYNRHDSDIHLIHRRLGPKSDIVKTARIIHSAQRTLTRFACSPDFLITRRPAYSLACMVAEQIILELWF